jgi:SARP family transcriptional regulator, regulator of embCAB operon
MQRALLVLLLLHANSYLSTARIIETLWAGRPPRTAPAVLQMYVTAVRRVLHPHGRGGPVPVLRTAPSSYGLWLPPGRLDLEQFRGLAGKGRELRAGGRCAEAAGAFRQAMELWRGPALGGLDDAGAFDPYTARLEEERLGVLQERIGVEICQGGSIAVIGELVELHRRHPFSESVCQQLMLALDLAGRRAEALRVYAGIRRALIDEVGLEPGPGLQATQRAILGTWSFPDLGYPRHAPQRLGTMWICEPRLFGGWPRGQPSDQRPVSRAAR